MLTHKPLFMAITGPRPGYDIKTSAMASDGHGPDSMLYG